MVLWPWNYSWSQFHYLMKALWETLLQFLQYYLHELLLTGSIMSPQLDKCISQIFLQWQCVCYSQQWLTRKILHPISQSSIRSLLTWFANQPFAPSVIFSSCYITCVYFCCSFASMLSLLPWSILNSSYLLELSLVLHFALILVRS